MAEKKSNISPLSSWDGPKIKEKLKSFKFDSNRIYSHKNETILIHAGNMDILEEIIDYELGRKEVQEKGVLIVRLSDEIRPVLSDESVVNFLLKSGDNDKCEQTMRPTEYIYENVSCKEGAQFPTGIMCQPILIESVNSGKSVIMIDKDQKKAAEKNNESSHVEGKNDGESDDDHDDDETYDTENRHDTITAKIQCLGYDCGIPDELQGVLRNGKFVLKKHNDKRRKDNCPCGALDGEKCSIFSCGTSPEGNFPLLHWAYLGHCRLSSFRKQKVRVLDRPNHEEMVQFENILAKLIDGTYSYEYMIYEGLINMEVPYSSKRYDMASQKNPLDKCLVGDPRGGITFPWTYIGLAGSIFPTHVEDIVYLNSCNLMVYGCPKIWIIVSPAFAGKLQQMVFEILNNWTPLKARNFYICTLLHKMTFVHPALLDVWGIPYTVVVQKPGDLLYTCAGAYHWGCNLGVNINIAKNSIQYDFKMRLLKELYDPTKDSFMCRPNCSQSFCRDLDEGVIGRFLLSFYKLLFKGGERQTEYEKELMDFFNIFYSGEGGGSTGSAQKLAFVDEQLKKKRDEIIAARMDNENSVLAKIQRLQCPVIREVSASFTFSFFHYAPDAVEPSIFPSHGVTLTPKEENSVLDGVPFNHIVIQHVEYGSSKEMNVSSYETIKPKRKSKKEAETESKSQDLKRVFLSYSLLNKYWTNVEEGKDYEKIEYNDPNKDHKGFLLDLTVLKKRLDLAKKKAKDDAKRKRNENSARCEVSDSSTDEDESDQTDGDDEEDTIDFALIEQRKLRGTAGFKILETSGRLQVVEVKGTKYFVCTTCYNFDNEVIATSKQLVKENKDVSYIESFLKKKLDGKNGVAVQLFNMKEHIKKWCEIFQCKHRECRQTFKTKHSLSLHIRGQHQSHLIFCPLCDIPFDYPIKLRDHWCDPESSCVKIMFFKKEKTLEVVGFQCSHCSNVMKKFEEWELHLKQSSECREKFVVQDSPQESD